VIIAKQVNCDAYLAVLNIQGCVDDRKRTYKRYNLFDLIAV